MKKALFLLFFAFYILVFTATPVGAQCSVCTKTAQQLGEKPAKGLNAGIIYLALTPLAIIGLVGYRWWKRNGSV